MIAESIILGSIIFGTYKVVNAFEKDKEQTQTLKEESKHTYSFIQDILTTNKEEWEYNGYSLKRSLTGENKEIVWHFFFNQEWEFYNYDTLHIHYNDTKVLTIEFCIEKNKLEIKPYRKAIFDNAFTKEEMRTFKKVLKHLRFLLIHSEMETEEEEVRKIEQEKQNKENQMIQKSKDLETLLNKKQYLKFHQKEGSIGLDVMTDGHYYALTLEIENKPYVEIIYSKTTQSYNATYFHEKSENQKIVGKFKKELMEYIKQVSFFSNMEIQEKQNSTLQTSSKIENHKKNILRKIEHLEKDKEWLSEESLHLLVNTFPSDLKKLISIYNKVKNKEDIEQEVFDSLDAIYQKLLDLEKEIESKMIQEIKHRKEVIKLR